MNRLCVVVMLVLCSGVAFPQNSHYGSFHLTLEPFLFQSRELLINGTTHNNPGYGFAADWQRISPENYQKAGLEFDWVRPKSPWEPAPVTVYFNINLHYAWLFSVLEKNDWKLYAGGRVTGDFRTSYYTLWDDSHAYWATFCGVAAQCLARRQLTTNKAFYVSFDLPLAGLISRPPKYRENKMDEASFGNIVSMSFQDPEFAHVVNLFNPDINAGLELLVSDRFSLAFFIHFEYLYVSASYSEKYNEVRKGLGIDFIF